ncbi:MAG: hypothetical protein RLZZ22_1961 [Pseudomonadota bacterium]|jgi:hypothetical protein
MSCKRLVRRWTAGWVLWAVLLHALAPAAAQAALWIAPALPFEVCASTGILRAVEPARESSQDSSPALAGAHCEWCRLDAPAILPPSLRVGFAASLDSPDPVAALRAPPARLADWRVQARAPPSFV